MAVLRFIMLLVSAVLVSALMLNDAGYEAVDHVDAIASAHSKELADNGIASIKNNYEGRKFGAKTNKGGDGKKETSMEVGNKQNAKEIMKEENGFVAFNADYHAPRHHPPKNN